MFEAEIERGARLLDERGPLYWRELLNLDALDVSHPERCVVGQLFNDLNRSYFLNSYDAGIYYLAGPTLRTGRLWWATQHGFSTASDRYATLTAEWRAYVARTRRQSQERSHVETPTREAALV